MLGTASPLVVHSAEVLNRQNKEKGRFTKEVPQSNVMFVSICFLGDKRAEMTARAKGNGIKQTGSDPSVIMFCLRCAIFHFSKYPIQLF